MNNKIKNCEEISKFLPALCFDELKQDFADEIHHHLADCESCMDEYLALSMALQKSKAAVTEEDLCLGDNQRSEIRKMAWAAELKLENPKKPPCILFIKSNLEQFNALPLIIH